MEEVFMRTYIKNISTPQGDSLSTILFTFYMAKSLVETKYKTQQEHNYCTSNETSSEDLLPEHLKDPVYVRPSNM